MKDLFYVKPIWFTFYMRDGSIIEGPAEKMGRFLNLPVVIEKNEARKKEIQNSNDQN